MSGKDGEVAAEDDNVDGNVAAFDENFDGKVDAKDENVTAVVDEKVSTAPCKEVITISPNSDSVLRSMRESFYMVYREHFEIIK
jgi:hypothetical protein